MFKKIIFSLALVIGFTTSLTITAQDVTVDEILANSFEITGGIDNWRALESVKMQGLATFNGGAMTADMTMYRKAPQFEKMEMQIQGKTFVQCFDGTSGWMINPFMGSEEPQELSEDELKDAKDRYFEDEFIDWQDKGHQVELEALEEGDPENTYRLKLTKKSGDVEYHFFDNENFVPIMVRSFSKNPETEGQMEETRLSDYLPVEGEVDGQAVTLYMPHSIETDDFSIKIEEGNIMLNPEEATEELFKMN